MLRQKLVVEPPKWVPGPYKPPTQPPMLPTQHKPSNRYYTAQGSETLAGLAEMFYGNSREAVRIFNANRMGMLRSDHAMGMLRSTQELVPAGAILLIP